MLWLIVAISAYLILAVVYLVDKYLLVGPIPNPKVYAFYVGILGLFVLLLIPFVGFSLPGIFQIFLSLASGASFVYGLYWFFRGLRLFEPSRIVPAVGGIIPFFSFLLIFIFSRGQETFSSWELLAFVLLILGSVLITYEKSKAVSRKSFRISLVAAFFVALHFVSAKYVYLGQPFWSGFIWIRIGGFLMAIFFLLFTREIRQEIFTRLNFSSKNFGGSKKTAAIFLSNQAAGAGANILQNWGIALAPLVIHVAFINALQGIQYVFLLIFTILLSLKFPRILKEEISKEVIFQKVVAILLVGAGLALLALK